MPRRLATFAAVLVLAAGCSQEEPVRGTAVAPAAAAEADLPTPVEPVDGNEYWAVYLAVGPEAIVSESLRWLTEQGLAGRAGPVDCDEGAETILRPEQGPERVAAFFEQVDDANVFAMGLPKAPAGIGLVTPTC